MSNKKLIFRYGQWYTRAALREIRQRGAKARISNNYFYSLNSDDELHYYDVSSWVDTRFRHRDGSRPSDEKAS